MAAAPYPASPGWKARTTSQAAAEAITPRAKTLREKVLESIRNCPASADEVAAKLGETVLATRPRLTELSALGLIADSGLRSTNVSGRKSIVWISCAGEQATSPSERTDMGGSSR
jgi:predicted ArsR family transcriptional regulator